MTKFIRAAVRVTEDVANGVAHGFAQMGSFGQSMSRRQARPSVSDSLRSDWVRLGGDMAKAIDKVKRERSA